MRTFLLGLFILIGTWGYSQSVSVKGKVIDQATGEPVVGANLTLPDNTGTYSDGTGHFNLAINQFPVTLRVSHVSYGETRISIKAAPGTELIIRLERLTQEIGEVQVSARALRNLTEKKDFTLQDFAFDRQSLWMIGYLNNQANQGRLWLANWFGDTITSIPVTRPERLLSDPFGNVHLVMADSVYHLFGKGNTIIFPFAYGQDDFFQIISPIRAVFAEKIVYQTFLPGQQGLHTYYYSGKDQQPYFLNVTRDQKEEKRVLWEYIYGPGMGLYYAAQSSNCAIRGEALIAIFKNKMTKELALNRLVEVPVFSCNDTLYIVNLYDDSLLSYSPAGQYIQSVPIHYHEDSILLHVHTRNLKYLVDPIARKTYILHRKATAWMLYHFDPVTGQTGVPVPLPNYPGMTGIQVHGRAVYFLYPEKKYPYYVRLYRYQL